MFKQIFSRGLLSGLVLLTADATAAPVHKCVSGERVVFSDKPCPSADQRRSINAAMTAYSGSESASNNRAGLSRLSATMARPAPVRDEPPLPSQSASTGSTGSCPYR